MRIIPNALPKLALAAGLALAPALPAAAQQDLWLAGVNYSGAEYGKLPGVMFKDYTYPVRRNLEHFFDEGFDSVRLAVKWERVQPELHGDLDAQQLAEIRKVIETAGEKGGRVILNPHNYARYHKQLIGSNQIPATAFTDFWRRLAEEFGNDERVIFGLMNEPFGISAADWAAIAEPAVAAIREAGAKNLVLVPGTAWTGAHSWFSSGNADAFAGFKDPGDNFAFEFHQYVDSDFSGTKTECPRVEAGRIAVERVSTWLAENNARGYLGEFGAPPNENCLEAMDKMLGALSGRRDVWIGFAYWAAGEWWGSYPMSIQPSKDGAERPQLPILKKYL